MRLPGREVARYHATPPRMRLSVTRSATESKNAPRVDSVPEAFATAPSSRSGRAAAASSTTPTPSQPAPMVAAAAPASTSPAAVR